MKVFQRIMNKRKGITIVILLLMFSLIQHLASSVSAESDTNQVHLESMTVYQYWTEDDSVEYDNLLTGEEYAKSELRNFDIQPVLDPIVTFTTDIQVSHTDGEFISPNTYQWLFPDLQVEEFISPSVWFYPSVSFTPGLTASRTITPTRFTYPGGEQTVTLTFTPKESVIDNYGLFLVSFGVRVKEDDNIDPTIVSVEWPSTSGSDRLRITSESDHDVGGFIQNPVVNTTYALVVTIDIEIKEGINAVQYKPHVDVKNRFSDWLGTHVGYGAISDTEAGTWIWQTGSGHSWLCWNSLQKAVQFLACSRLLPVEATVDIDPDTLNLKSRGKWITAYIELPEEYSVSDIDISTVELSEQGFVAFAERGEVDDDVLVVKFDRSTVIEYLDGRIGEVILTLTGEVAGVDFEGSDKITVN